MIGENVPMCSQTVRIRQLEKEKADSKRRLDAANVKPSSDVNFLFFLLGYFTFSLTSLSRLDQFGHVCLVLTIVLRRLTTRIVFLSAEATEAKSSIAPWWTPTTFANSRMGGHGILLCGPTLP